MISDDPTPPNVTLEEIARAAGVSPSTVSRILNGTVRVSSEKRQAVEQAIAQFRYRPNVLARSLASGRTDTIGVLTQTVASPFYAEWLRGIEEALYEPGLTPVFVSSRWNVEEERTRVEQFIARRVDGIIILHGQLDESRLEEFSRQTPIVVLGRSLEAGPTLAGFPIDNVQGAFDATHHLIAQGHRKIAFIAGPPNHTDALERLVGYRMALEEAGIPFDAIRVEQGDFVETGGVAAMERLIDRGVGFTAVFCANDQTAYGARLVLYRRGLRVPEDVSLVGFDDVPTSLYTTPPLTTVRQPIYELGRQAAEAIVGLIRKEPVTSSPAPLSLIVRETTCAPRSAESRAASSG
ncbi:LacI family DNA-binding transcriptional regulator [Paraburkholderia dinghuensis]|uniref:LacI family transcriptional regulator n=1 Tax=Paraburkholderia dinghuensis TaxID=2305225 RepID=A0A3N6NZY0_9BURK|nr:substrate-binding domain-containing protein [Paraburkholderia dinghuensis]RQH06533.1 LacI family transcriptional regulator [Paraburkholderia dinghuensis]